MVCPPDQHRWDAGVTLEGETWPRYICCGHRVAYPGRAPIASRYMGLRFIIKEPFRRRRACRSAK